MASTNCRPRIVIVYASVTGNTKKLAEMIACCIKERAAVTLCPVREFPYGQLQETDALLIGTYSWGNGSVPGEMRPLYEAVEQLDRSHLVTAAFGTGDRFYPDFCGAVDRFRDMLHACTELAVTLKAELLPQEKDYMRCQKFADKVLERIEQNGRTEKTS